MSHEMFIRYQGEIQGETELAAQMLCQAYRRFRKYGNKASMMRQFGRLCWSSNPQVKPRGLHLIANHKGF